MSIQTEADFRALLPQLRGAIAWPVCYTIGPQVDGPLLAALLDASECAYVGANSLSLQMSSKLVFKEQLQARSHYRSPDFIRVNELEPTSDISALGFPLMLKTEFSCNSEGVALIDSMEVARRELLRMRKRFAQNMYFERWERAREYTVAYLPESVGQTAVAAAVELIIKSDALFIDEITKQDNTQILFSRPAQRIAVELERATLEIAELLGIDGYFRIDFLENEQGRKFPIELNFLPFLSHSTIGQSYFPTAMSSIGVDFASIIDRLLKHAEYRTSRRHAPNT